jgi:hypothetical protein
VFIYPVLGRPGHGFLNTRPLSRNSSPPQLLLPLYSNGLALTPGTRLGPYEVQRLVSLRLLRRSVMKHAPAVALEMFLFGLTGVSPLVLGGSQWAH